MNPKISTPEQLQETPVQFCPRSIG